MALVPDCYYTAPVKITLPGRYETSTHCAFPNGYALSHVRMRDGRPSGGE